MSDQKPPVYFVLLHSPGERWTPNVSFREQPGIMEHVQFMSSIMQNKQLVMGGPFLDNSGGIMIIRSESLEAARELANTDPTVKNGLL